MIRTGFGRAILLLAALSGVVWWLHEGATHTGPATATRPVAPTPAVQPIAAVAERVREVRDAPVKSPIDVSLRERFSRSRNYSEFIAAAKRDVVHGGGAYALHAMQTCDDVMLNLRELQRSPRRPAENSRDIVARAEAKALLEARCATVDGPGYSLLTYGRQLTASGEEQRDPLRRIYRSAIDSRNLPGARESVLEAILEAQDPLLVEQFQGRIVDVDWKQRTAFFDGVVHDVDREPALLAAAALLVCGLGFDCTVAHDTNVALTCLVHTVCEHDRFALAKLQADAQGYSFDRVMDFHRRMVDAFKSRRIDAFLRRS